MADQPVSGWREPLSRRARRWARRNRTAVTAAAAAIVAGVIGLAAVLAVQARLNSDLRAKNLQLATASTRIGLAYAGLADANQQVQARFDLAMEAIRTFHTGVSEDVLLKQKELEELRTKLFRGRASSIASSKPSSADKRAIGRRGAGGRLRRDRPTVGQDRIEGGRPRRPPARPGVARAAGRRRPATRRPRRSRPDAPSHRQHARPGRPSRRGDRVLRAGEGDLRGAGPGRPRCRVRAGPRACDRDIGYTHYLSGKPAEALPALERASAALEALPPAERPRRKPGRAGTHAQLDLPCPAANWPNVRGNHDLSTLDRDTRGRHPVRSHHGISRRSRHLRGQSWAGLPPARSAHRGPGNLSPCGSTRERIAKAYPGITSFQVQLANVYNSLGNVLEELNRPEESIPAMERAAEIYEPLVKANPTATQVATNQATILSNLGLFQAQAGRLEEARTSYERSLTISRKLARTIPPCRSSRVIMPLPHPAWASCEHRAATARRSPTLSRGEPNPRRNRQSVAQ